MYIISFHTWGNSIRLEKEVQGSNSDLEHSGFHTCVLPILLFLFFSSLFSLSFFGGTPKIPTQRAELQIIHFNRDFLFSSSPF